MRFGLPTMGSGGLRFVQDQIDTWIIGRRLGPASVGLYNKAFTLTTRIGSMLTTSIFGNVLFPSYAKIKDDIPRLTRAYLKSNKMVFLMIVPVSIGLAITAPLLVSVLLGEQWIPMIRVWQLFALYGLTRPISVNSSPIFMAVGQPRRNMTASIVLMSLMIPLILLLIGPYGIEGAAFAVSFAHMITVFFNVYQVNQILPGTARQTIVQSLPFLAAGGAMALGVLLLQDGIIALAGGPNFLALVLMIALSAIIYVAAILLLQRDLVLETYELIIKSLRFDKRWPHLLPARLRTTK
jgi:O-antigen/teichoic acid export membrane protein